MHVYNKEYRKKLMKDFHLRYLALRTCQWCQAVIKQGRRFLTALEQSHGDKPWDENVQSSMFLAERFSRQSLHRKNEHKLRKISQHDLDYLTSYGNDQNQFTSTVNKGTYQFETYAFLNFHIWRHQIIFDWRY